MNFYFDWSDLDEVLARNERKARLESEIEEAAHFYDEVLAGHNEGKARRCRRRKNTFRAGTRRQRMCKTWPVKPRSSLRDNYWKGHFQYDTAAADSKFKYGRHSNSNDKLSMNHKRRKELEAANYQEQEDFAPEVEPLRQPRSEYDQIWDAWQNLCDAVCSGAALSDAEMKELSCTDILYLATKYCLGGGANLWEEPDATRYEVRTRNLWDCPHPGEIDIGDGTILVPVVDISPACRRVEQYLFVEDPWD